MTETEKDLRIRQIDAALRCGGGKLAPEGEANARAILGGEKTVDQVIAELDAKYKRAAT